MKICIFGATGPTGRELVAQALEQGHEVTAFARRPEKLNVPAIQGDTTRDYDAVARAVRGQDAVLSALGVGATFTPDALMLRSLRNIERAMLSQRVQRLIVMSAFGVGETRRDAPLVPRLMYCTLLSAIFADKLAAESELRATQLGVDPRVSRAADQRAAHRPLPRRRAARAGRLADHIARRRRALHARRGLAARLRAQGRGAGVLGMTLAPAGKPCPWWSSR
jgi:uncharacterized protein YbjT (DUF2867 family)